MSDISEYYKNRDPLKRIIARALCIKNGRVCVIKRFKYGDTYFVLPGGGIDNNESVFDAAVRELREETSIEAKAIKLLVTLPSTQVHSEQNIVLCDYLRGEPHLPATSEESSRTDGGQNTYEPMWISIDEAKHKLVPEELRTILD